MKKYHLIVMSGGCWSHTVEADKLDSTTNSSTSGGYYAFYKNSKLVACYPIDRTIISKIENI